MRTTLLEYLKRKFRNRYFRGGSYLLSIGLLTMVAYAAINSSNNVNTTQSTSTSATTVTVASSSNASAPVILSQSRPSSASSAVSTTSAPTGIQYTTDRYLGRSSVTANSTTAAPQISYHGGAVLKGTTNVYLVWYGNWSQNTTAYNSTSSTINDFIKNVGVSSWISSNVSYAASTRVTLAGQANDSSYSQGTALTANGVANIVVSAINNKSIPLDPNGVYYVLSSADVTETQPDGTSFDQAGGFCGWHTYATLNTNAKLHFGFVGNPANNLGACTSQNLTASPNNNPVADSMVNTLAHEIEETITDPEFDGWYFSDGSKYNNSEMADPCGYTYGQTFPAGSNVNANLSLGARNYLLQQTWNAAQQTCTNGQYNTNTLLPGQTLYANNKLTSPDGQSILAMQADGNLVEYKNGLAVWSSSTTNSSGNTRAVMQSDGNLVIYNGSSALWTSNSTGKPQSILALQNDGNIVVYQTTLAWSSNVSRSAPSSGTSLVIGSGTGALTPNTQLWSGNGLFEAVMQADGNFVVYQTNASAPVVWATSFGGGGWGTVMSAGGSAFFQNDGNFVLYSPAGAAYWASNTSGGPSSYLSFEDSGLLNIHSPRTVTWASSWHTTNNLL